MALLEQLHRLIGTQVLQHVGVIDRIARAGGKGQTAAQVVLHDAGGTGRQVEIAPGGMNLPATADVDELHQGLASSVVLALRTADHSVSCRVRSLLEPDGPT
jgi:hypothetical protein